MVAIRYNKPTEIQINYVAESGAIAQLTLLPGVTVGIDEIEWESAKRHPTVQALMAENLIEPLINAPVITKEMDVHTEGEVRVHEVVEGHESGQPIPVSDPPARTRRRSPP